MAVTITDKSAGYARLLRVAESKSPTLKVGVLTDEQHKGGSGRTVGEIAEIHEVIGVPTKDGGRVIRPWLRPVVDGRRALLKARLKRVAEAVALGRVTVQQGMGLLGQELVNLIKARIRAGIPPALTEATKRRKERTAGQSKDIPLIDTSQFIGDITYEVK